MKHTKKLVSLLLTLVMVLSMSVTAFAAETTANDGKITINNAVDGKNYSIYKIMDLESFEKNSAYSYKATADWKTWLESQTDYVSFDDQGYASWVESADAAAFAKAALEHAKTLTEESTQTIAATATKVASDSTVTFEALSLGYYLVDSPLGALCFLDTTDKEVTIAEKNTAPTITKQVQEDSDDSWGNSNTAQIGDTVNFKVTIKAHKGAENYVLHDKMDDGLTLNSESIVVKATPKDGTETTLTANIDYTVATDNSVSESGEDPKCTFEIEFKDTYLNSIDKETDIVVTYSAVLNKNAKISTDTNDNTANLFYADKNSTEDASTSTATFKFDIVKTDSSNKLLNGAEFELYLKNGDNYIKVPVVKDDEVYRVKPTVEAGTDVVIAATNGKATVTGLDANKDYYLKETKAPAGYNKISGYVEVGLVDANKTTTMTGDTWQDGNGGVHVINKTGTELPFTGGIGTTIFYVAGSVLVLAAAVLLITKKRMSEEK